MFAWIGCVWSGFVLGPDFFLSRLHDLSDPGRAKREYLTHNNNAVKTRQLTLAVFCPPSPYFLQYFCSGQECARHSFAMLLFEMIF